MEPDHTKSPIHCDSEQILLPSFDQSLLSIQQPPDDIIPLGLIQTDLSLSSTHSPNKNNFTHKHSESDYNILSSYDRPVKPPSRPRASTESTIPRSIASISKYSSMPSGMVRHVSCERFVDRVKAIKEGEQKGLELDTLL